MADDPRERFKNLLKGNVPVTRPNIPTTTKPAVVASRGSVTDRILAKRSNAACGFLLDKSYSMAPHQPDVIAGYNSYIEILKRHRGITFQSWQFSNTMEQGVPPTPINLVPDLNEYTYNPFGGTALIDSALKAIDELAEQVAERPAGTKVVMVIQTDGQDTSAKSWDPLHAKIAEKRAQGWEFQFLGANLDAYKMAGLANIPPESALSYNVTETKAAFTRAGLRTVEFLGGENKTAGFKKEDRKAVKDEHVPPKLLK